MTERPHVDVRTRGASSPGSVDPDAFWSGPWARALEHHGARAGREATELELAPLTLEVDGQAWTLAAGPDGLRTTVGGDDERVVLDAGAFADLVTERRTALGLVVAGRVEGDGPAVGTFVAWDPLLRSVLDGRALYRSGDVDLRALDGSPLDLDQRFALGERDDEAAHFLAEAGFVLLTGVFDEAELDQLDAELAAAVEAVAPDDGCSWWATTDQGERYPCRVLDLADRSPTLRRLFTDPRFLAIGELLGDGHRPGDPFGEHFADVTAEGLVKRVGSVEGLACLPWHKDCERGGHSHYCSGLTLGICLTPVDRAHGGLDVMAGSHRAHVARAQVDRGVDLPAVELTAERGDLTVHLSCALHRSTHPTTDERRVIYTGFALPPEPGTVADRATAGQATASQATVGQATADQAELARQRAAIADRDRQAPLWTGARR